MNLRIKFIPEKMHVKKGDKVKVISGKDKGVIGEVLRSYPKMGKVIVDGVNVKTKHVKPTQNAKGQIVKMPSPIFSCKVMYYSEDKNGATRLGKRILDDGTKVRFMKKFKETI